MTGLTLFIVLLAGGLLGWAVWLVMRAEDRRDPDPYARQAREAHAHVMRLKHGNTWGTQAIRAQLIVLRKLIETSPAAPPHPFAGRAPGTAAAAGHQPPPAPPPLPSFDAIEQATAAACEQALAETAELARSFNTPPDGA